MDFNFVLALYVDTVDLTLLIVVQFVLIIVFLHLVLEFEVVSCLQVCTSLLSECDEAPILLLSLQTSMVCVTYFLGDFVIDVLDVLFWISVIHHKKHNQCRSGYVIVVRRFL